MLEKVKSKQGELIPALGLGSFFPKTLLEQLVSFV